MPSENSFEHRSLRRILLNTDPFGEFLRTSGHYHVFSPPFPPFVPCFPSPGHSEEFTSSVIFVSMPSENSFEH